MTNNMACESIIPLEDCKCPICLDYFIDVVETRCHHRFCSFCLENWLRVGMHRRCPTCRSLIFGSIPVKQELQEIINTSIQPVLSEDAVRERLLIRSERHAQVERLTGDREQTQTLLTRITSSRPRATRQIRFVQSRRDDNDENGGTAEPGPPLLARHIMNWWDDNNDRTADATRTYHQLNRIREGRDIEDLSIDWHRRLHALNDFENNIESEGPTHDVINPAYSPNWTLPDPSSNAVRGNQPGHNRRRVSSQLDQSYHENLMEEYSYHLRRVNSAHLRIREAYRDFNYHNVRMEDILQEHRSFFSGMRVPTENTAGDNESNVVTYEDFEDLLRTEMGELLDNSPAAQVVFGRFASENTLPSSNVSRSLHEATHPRTFGRGLDNNYTSRESQPNSSGYSSGSLSHRTDVIDMELEMQNRRHQMNRLSSLIRNCPWNSASRISRGASGGIPNSPSSLSTPIQFAPTQTEFNRNRDDALLQSSAQHQIMVERLSGGNSTISAPCSRRMRRRMTRNNLMRINNTNVTNDATYNNNVIPPTANNSCGENTFRPTVSLLQELRIGTGASSDVTPSNARTNLRPISNAISSSNNSTRTERGSHNVSSAGWIINASSDSEEERQRNREIIPRFTIRTGVRSANTSAQRTMSVPPRTPRTFRRATRFHRRRFNVLVNRNTDSSTATAPASSSSNTNVSNIGGQIDELRNDNEENSGHLEDASEGQETLSNRTVDTDTGVPSHMHDISNMGYIEMLRDQYKTR